MHLYPNVQKIVDSIPRDMPTVFLGGARKWGASTAAMALVLRYAHDNRNRDLRIVVISHGANHRLLIEQLREAGYFSIENTGVSVVMYHPDRPGLGRVEVMHRFPMPGSPRADVVWQDHDDPSFAVDPQTCLHIICQSGTSCYECNLRYVVNADLRHMVVEPSIWEVKDRVHRSGEVFFVTPGTRKSKPKISLDGPISETSMRVPIEYLNEFENDIHAALRDIAGHVG
jgi:hypothetical protein